MEFNYSTYIKVKRKFINRLAILIACLIALVGLALPFWILFTVVGHGMNSFNWNLFTDSTPPPDGMGGLKNAIVGSLLMVAIAMAIATPIGVMVGIYLAEYGPKSKLASAIRFLNDILLSAPSIVIGLFVYTVIVVPTKHFSGWAGIVSIAIIAVPIIVRTSESMLLLVPDIMREGAYALGSSKRQTVLHICLPAARNGIITGLLLAMARISGETAPLLFTSLNNQFYSNDLNQPMANLPVTIFQFAMSPYENWQSLAWAGAALIVIYVVILNTIARVVFARNINK